MVTFTIFIAKSDAKNLKIRHQLKNGNESNFYDV
jgi:hypothetical protein